jgi:hypothetical protein
LHRNILKKFIRHQKGTELITQRKTPVAVPYCLFNTEEGTEEDTQRQNEIAIIFNESA